MPRPTIALFVLLLSACTLLDCGENPTTQPLTLQPSSLNITVDSMTGNQTGATAFQAFRGKTLVDLSTLTWTPSSPTVPSECFGVDQTYVPHCNAGCGASYSGTITATDTGTSSSSTVTGTNATGNIVTSVNSATVPITCTWQ